MLHCQPHLQSQAHLQHPVSCFLFPRWIFLCLLILCVPLRVLVQFASPQSGCRAQPFDMPRRYAGTRVRLLMVLAPLLAPLLVPLVGWLVYGGVSHMRTSHKLPLSVEWLEEAARKQHALSKQPESSPMQGSDSAGASSSPFQAATQKGFLARDSSENTPVEEERRKATGELMAGETDEREMLINKCTSLEQGVVLSGLEQHEGIVSSDSSRQLHALQEQMVRQLSTLSWRRVDVQIAHYHSHAAIVVRDARFDLPPARAFFAYFANNFVR